VTHSRLNAGEALFAGKPAAAAVSHTAPRVSVGGGLPVGLRRHMHGRATGEALAPFLVSQPLPVVGADAKVSFSTGAQPFIRPDKDSYRRSHGAGSVR